MAWASVPEERLNAAQRTTPGQRWSDVPDLGAAEEVVLAPGCNGCPRREAHGIACVIGARVPHGAHSSSVVPEVHSLRVADLRRLYELVWAATYIHNGHVEAPTIYNVGPANNADEILPVEIVGVSGNVLTVRGENPRRIVRGRTYLNPDWPAEGPRILSDDEPMALNAGAMVDFAPPSVLAGKLRPWIVSISAPDSEAEVVTYDVELSCAVDACVEPIDAAFPPGDGKYRATIRFYGLFPENWPNYQVETEAQWTLREVTFGLADVAGGKLALRNTAEGETRVLWPDMLPAGWCMLSWSDGAGGGASGLNPQGRLTTEQLGAGSWRTRLEVGDLVTAGATSFTVRFFPEARAADGFRMLGPGSCANSQVSPAGWEHAGGKRCTNVGCSQFGTFEATCWQPNASGFCTGTERRAYRRSAMRRAPTDIMDPAPLARLWGGTSWVGIQTLAGIPFFSLSRPAGAMGSFAQLLGGRFDEAFTALASTRFSYYGVTYGRRVVETDEDGNESQRVATGAFVDALATWDAVGARENPPQGSVPLLVPEWRSGRADARGNAVREWERNYPRTPVSGGGVHSYAVEAHALDMDTRLVGGVEAVAAGQSLAPNDDVTARVRARAEG